MFLTQQDEDAMDGSVKIIKRLFDRIRDIPIEDAKKDISEFSLDIRQKYCRKDTKDTSFADMVAEDIICGSRNEPGHSNLIRDVYDIGGVIITEEQGKYPRDDTRIDHRTPVIISDPIDASKYFDKMMSDHSGKKNVKRVGDAFDKELVYVGTKARRHACNSSLTMLRDNSLKYTVVANLLTDDIYIASPRGVLMGDISKVKGAGDINTEVKFSDHEGKKLICYTTEKGKYEINRHGTHLRLLDFDKAEYRNAVGDIGVVGPLRFTYLLDYNGDVSPFHVVGHNGEKIQEALPNIVVARYSKGRLNAYKLFCDDDELQVRANVALTPNLANSLYSDGLIRNMGIKTDFLNRYSYPSQFRDTTAIIVRGNEDAETTFSGMVQNRYAVRIV